MIASPWTIYFCRSYAKPYLSIQWKAWLSLQQPERLQTPLVFRLGPVLPQDVEIAVVGTHLEKSVRRAIPLIEHFFDGVFAAGKLKANRPFVGLPARVAFHPDLHLVSIIMA